jgi:hypothetical protein
VSERSSTVLRVVFFLGACTAMTAFWTVVLLVSLHRPSDRVLASWPRTAHDDEAQVRLNVLETDWNFRGFPLQLQRNVVVQIGRTPTQGHSVQYSFNPSSEDRGALERHLRNCTVTWAPEGVTLAEPDGHRLFVPARAYLGGR